MNTMELLQNFYLFHHLNEEQFERLKEISHIASYKKDTILFFEGDKPKSLMILIEGTIKVYKTDQKGNSVTIHRFFPIDMIAEITNLEGTNYPASAIFETDGKLLLINYEIFKQEFLSNPKILLEFVKSLSKKIKYLENLITTNMVMNSTARVAKFICEHNKEISTLKKSAIAADLNITPRNSLKGSQKALYSWFNQKRKR
jgi:CRP/FNR family transcriptional regulator